VAQASAFFSFQLSSGQIAHVNGQVDDSTQVVTRIVTASSDALTAR